MKAAKLPLTTILIAFSLALAGVESNAGESAKQPAGEQKNQSSLVNQTTAGERTGLGSLPHPRHPNPASNRIGCLLEFGSDKRGARRCLDVFFAFDC
jgi:hypothetical protein